MPVTGRRPNLVAEGRRNLKRGSNLREGNLPQPTREDGPDWRDAGNRNKVQEVKTHSMRPSAFLHRGLATPTAT